MANSQTITKALTIPQMNLLKHLDEQEVPLLTISSIREAMQGTENLNELVENLVRKGFLHRLERGKYCRSTFHDEHVIGTFVAPDSAVAYWSALNLHGLTEQFPNIIFVQTTRKKSQASILGTTYRFVKVSPPKRAGVTFNGYGSYRYPITDVEKTIVDCFDLPQYGGGYAELIRAFYRAELKAEKLIGYCTAVDNLAVTKRLGFLSELLGKKELRLFTEFAKAQVNRSYNLFDPLGQHAGEAESAWHLRLNVSKSAILGAAQNPY